MRSAVRIGVGNYMTYATGEEPGQRNRKPSPKRYSFTTVSWVTVKHPSGTPDAPTYGKKCQKCGRQNHIDKACMRGRPTKFEETDKLYDEQTAAFAELCTVARDSADDGLRMLRLTRHQYDDMCDKWTKRASSPQPYIHLTLTNEREDYKALGL